ncbi:MAG: hypothetical protein HY391_00150, partial [Deltaproteobacteria bacterium]|nr:hypothetical protein [Deltaproteobacteria bacterium]
SNVIPIKSLFWRLPEEKRNTASQQLKKFTGPLSGPMWEKLSKLRSKYPDHFDYTIYDQLHKRFEKNIPRGGVLFKTTLKLINSHTSCQQCLYAFEIDTYGRGCVHDCVYCYAKTILEGHGYWNRPIPFPIDITDIRKTFFIVFETSKKNKWRHILEKRIPIRIGSMSDSFMWMDKKYRVTLEFLKILKFYRYPYIIATRSDLIAEDEYIEALDPTLSSVQMSIASINDDLNRKIEPGAPSGYRRLKALRKLVESGFWTTVRINPLFPIYPNGYFTDPDYDHTTPSSKFDYFSFDMIDAIADHKVQSLLVGFVRLSGTALNEISKASDIDLRPFFGEKKFKRSSNYHYSDAEIRHYYEEIKRRCNTRGVQFTTCYIGNGETHFWKDQDLWSNKSDCCNAKLRINAFKNDSRSIPFADRLKHTGMTCSKPNDSTRLHEPIGEPADIAHHPAVSNHSVTASNSPVTESNSPVSLSSPPVILSEAKDLPAKSPSRHPQPHSGVGDPSIESPKPQDRP